MNVASILTRLTERASELGMTDAELSRKSDGSSDLIRNWRRSIRENRSTMPRYDKLTRVAQALGVDVGWLINGTSDPQLQPGMAEGEATPWVPPDGFLADPSGVARALTRTAARPSAFRVTTDLPAFGLLSGDVLIVDQKRLPAAGDLAIGNAETEGGFTTVIGRYFPPNLVTAAAIATGRVAVVDHERVSLYHPVVASFRSYAHEDF